jgi:hypothetical protein
MHCIVNQFYIHGIVRFHFYVLSCDFNRSFLWFLLANMDRRQHFTLGRMNFLVLKKIRKKDCLFYAQFWGLLFFQKGNFKFRIGECWTRLKRVDWAGFDISLAVDSVSEKVVGFTKCGTNQARKYILNSTGRLYQIHSLLPLPPPLPQWCSSIYLLSSIFPVVKCPMNTFQHQVESTASAEYVTRGSSLCVTGVAAAMHAIIW